MELKAPIGQVSRPRDTVARRGERSMKKFGIVVGVIVAVLVVALAVLRVAGLDPNERRAGLWLTGEVVTTPVTDWSFTDKYRNIYVQTKTRYLVPHSVTTGCTAKDGKLYLTSIYRPGQQFPRDKAWNRNFVRDPRVRLKMATSSTTRRWLWSWTRPRRTPCSRPRPRNTRSSPRSTRVASMSSRCSRARGRHRT